MTELDIERVIAKGIEKHPGVKPQINSDNGLQLSLMGYITSAHAIAGPNEVIGEESGRKLEAARQQRQKKLAALKNLRSLSDIATLSLRIAMLLSAKRPILSVEFRY